MNATDPSPDASDSKKSDPNTKLLRLGFPGIILIWFAYYYFQSPFEKDASFDRLNTLFSGLAFWGVVYAILLQKSELTLQRNELKLTRVEVRGQKEQLEAQNLTMKRQRFENTFFSLLDLLSNMVNSMELPPQGIGNLTKGRDCFSLFCYEFDRSYRVNANNHPTAALKQLCVEAFSAFHNSHQSQVDHYFLTLFNIIRYVDSSDAENKSDYINFLKAQLSSSELKLLLYYCLSGMGPSELESLLQKHGLFENLRKETLTNHSHLSLLKDPPISDHT